MKRIFFTAIFIAAALVAFAQLEQPKPKPAQPKPAQPSTEKPMQSTQKSQKQIQCEQRWKDGKEAYDNGDYSTALFFFNKAVDDGCDNMPYSDYIEMCNIKMSATPKGVTQQTSTPQSSSQQSSIQQFFPIYGVTLGQTTTNDAKQMGYKVEKGSSGTSNVSRIETIYFWDHNNDNVYEQIYMTCYDKMPQEWINKFGFNVDLSYSEWLDLFKKMGFTVEIKTTPQTTKYEGRNTLEAKFTALSSDKLLSFELNFNYGNDNNEGYSIYSKKSLYGITIKTSAIQKGVTQQTSTPQSSSQQSSIQQFFPIYGVTLGQTTTDDTRRMGYEVKAGSNGTSNYSIIETIWLRDFDNDNVWETMIIHNDEKMPQVWINKFGFNLDLSYSEWLDLFKRMGFTIEINTSPQTTEYQGRNTLKAEFTALSPDKLLSFKLYFNYGNRNNEGYSIYSKKSLDDIWIKTSAIQKGVTPQSSSQQSSNPVVKRFFSDFFPIYGITLGQTTTYDVKRMGYEVEKKGSYNYSYIETIQFYDWDNDNVYEDMAIFNNDYRKIPQTWINKFGFNFDLSYSEWLDLFQKMGCTITINTNPQTTGYEGRNTLKAKFSALSPDKLLNFELYFEKGNKNNEGYSISSKKSLYYINVRKQ